MRISANLMQQVSKAVETSMRIEGYAPATSTQTQQQAKAVMEKQRVKISVPRK